MSNLRKHELKGLLMLFLSGSLLGFGLFLVFWGANRPLFYGSLDYLLTGKEYFLIPFFFGLGFILWAMGHIELRDVRPGK